MTHSFPKLLITILVAVGMLLTSFVASAQMKFVVVDVQRAVMETEDGLRAQATLKKLFDKRQRELDSRQEQLQRARDDIERQAKVLSKDALQRRTEEWQKSMMELQTVFVEFNRELQKKQSELTQPIVGNVLKVISQIASQEGYDGVLERNAVPYIRSDLDITDKVIQRYNASFRSAEPPATGPVTPPAKQPPAPAKQAPAPPAKSK